MTSPAVSVRPETPLAEAVALMLRERIGSVVVCDGAHPGRVAGILTESDLEIREARVPLAYPEGRAPRILDRWVQTPEQLERALREAAARRVADHMTSPVWTIDADADLWEAVGVMLERGVRRLPVLEDGRLAGVIARVDVLKAMLAAGGVPGPARRG